MIVAQLFASPEWLPALLLAPLAWLALEARDRARARRLAELFGPRASELAAELDPRARRRRRALAGAALLFLLLALCEPHFGRAPHSPERGAVDLIVCLDVSRSMLARDVPPSRLGVAHQALRELAAHAVGDRLGLVVFAGEARLAVPLTRDLASFAELAAQADPDSVEVGGTDLGQALRVALQALDPGAHGVHGARGAVPAGARGAVVLVSDGEDHGRHGVAAARALANLGIATHCVGVGTTAGGKIPIPGPDGERFLRDGAGREVITRLDSSGLRAIAAAGGGRYVDASSSTNALLELHGQHVARGARAPDGEEPEPERAPRFQWALLAAFALGLLELCLSDRRRR